MKIEWLWESSLLGDIWVGCGLFDWDDFCVIIMVLWKLFLIVVKYLSIDVRWVKIK